MKVNEVTKVIRRNIGGILTIVDYNNVNLWSIRNKLKDERYVCFDTTYLVNKKKKK